MIVAVERHFGVKFKNAEVAKLKCVGDLVGLIKKKKPELQ
jgi:acyl carrier protein